MIGRDAAPFNQNLLSKAPLPQRNRLLVAHALRERGISKNPARGVRRSLRWEGDAPEHGTGPPCYKCRNSLVSVILGSKRSIRHRPHIGGLEYMVMKRNGPIRGKSSLRQATSSVGARPEVPVHSVSRKPARLSKPYHHITQYMTAYLKTDEILKLRRRRSFQLCPISFSPNWL